jgi:LmbE family N-acetylglucosaminyl deacetylase
VLDARPVWLDFVDHQYLERSERAAPDEIAKALSSVLDASAPTAVFLPMGLANPDHVDTHDAGVLLASERPDITWFCYEDSGYKHIPGMLAWRIAKLFSGPLWPTPMIVPVDLDVERKRTAIEKYASQIAPLNRDHSLGARIGGGVPEQFWLLAPPPSGWVRMREM